MSRSKLVLQSQRLGFRLPEEDDLENLISLDTDPDVRAHFPEGVLTLEQVRERIDMTRASFAENGFCDFVMAEIESGDFVGRAGFGILESGDIEVGYVLLKKYWGQGLAQEALKALLAWAKNAIDTPRILAYAPTTHTASFNVMKKCGMRYMKTDIMRNTECDIYEYPLVDS